MQKILMGLSFAFAVATFGLTGCGKIDNAIDCHSICSRYQTCFDKNYDTGACEGRCKNASAADANYQHEVDVCNTCINDQDCTAAAFKCSSQCNSVVP